MGRVASGYVAGFWGALTVLAVHSAAWAQQAPAPGPAEPGTAVAGPGFPESATPPAAGAGAEAAPYQGQPYQGQPYQGQPYQGQPYQGQPYQTAPAPGYSPYPPPPPYQPYGYPYGYGRPAYGYAPRPYYAYPSPVVVPVRSLLDRPFELRLGFGVSSLRYHDLYGDEQNDGGGNWNFQIGFGLAPRLILLFGVDSVFAGGSSSYTYEQTALTVGAQVFLLQRLYLRGGIGTAARSASDNFDTFTDSRWGTAGLLGAGFELIQSYHWAMQVEWDLIATHFSSDDVTWTSNTLGLGITFF